jgi:hypothetical protein
MKKATTILLQPAGGLICGLAILLAGCSGLDGVPREAGLYAVDNDVSTRLDGDPKWERETWEQRSNFPPGVSFVIRDSGLATGNPEQLIQLHRVGWVRSEITPAGEIQPSVGSQWANAPIEELRVPVQLSRHDDHEDVIRVTPLGELTPGLYTLSALPPAGIQARFGVQWPGVDRRAYAAAHCVDRYPGSPERYRTCAQQDLEIASRQLKIHLVKPETHNLPGQPRQLVVKGVVINTSDRSSRVPPLQGRLVNREGVVIKRWEFLADTSSLAPGASATFETRVTNPPVGASNVQVTFESFQPSLGQATGHGR